MGTEPAMTPKRIILHCSATPEDKDYTAADIDKWHKANGWKGIGYHWVIRKSGLIEKGRRETEQGAHAKHHNEDSIGICVIGTSEYTHEQVESLMELYLEIKGRWNIAPNMVIGHSELPEHKGRECPNVTMPIVRALLSLAY